MVRDLLYCQHTKNYQYRGSEALYEQKYFSKCISGKAILYIQIVHCNGNRRSNELFRFQYIINANENQMVIEIKFSTSDANRK